MEKASWCVYLVLGVSLALTPTLAFGDVDSKGPNGINVPSIGLNGAGVDVGEIDETRSGDPTGPDGMPFDTVGSLINSSVDPFRVYWRTRATGTTPAAFTAHANTSSEIKEPGLFVFDDHAIAVAGVMISKDNSLIGVAPNANLYSIGVNSFQESTDHDPGTAEAMQYLITETQSDIRVINMSILNPPADSNHPFDGDELLSQFIDWSASANGKDILYVVSGTEGANAPNVIPSDNFNGMTVASSVQNNGKWSMVGANNNFSKDANGDRTSISLIAPGFDYKVPISGSSSVPISDLGSDATSFAAPQVSGAVALLQQFAVNQGSATQWAVDARRHQVMKAVLMNSADKLVDDHTVMVNGSLVPPGGLLGMTRTVTDQNGQNWLQSEAYPDDNGSGADFTPLDDQMGAGELNVGRALQQLAPGKHAADSGDVPQIGWDFGHTAGKDAVNHYPIAGTLQAQHFISITLAWDRAVIFKSDANSNGKYDIGDTFQESTVTFPNPDSDDLINDLAIYLLPKGAATIQQAVADSISDAGVVQHIFFQLPTTGEYEIWVKQRDQENLLPLQNGQDYALAWWYGLAPPLIVAGDYNGDGTINTQDYAVWKSGFGSTVTPGTGADGNGDGVINATDYIVWRNALAAGSGSGSAAVPEPTALATLALLFAVVAQIRRRPAC